MRGPPKVLAKHAVNPDGHSSDWTRTMSSLSGITPQILTPRDTIAAQATQQRIAVARRRMPPPTPAPRRKATLTPPPPPTPPMAAPPRQPFRRWRFGRQRPRHGQRPRSAQPRRAVAGQHPGHGRQQRIGRGQDHQEQIAQIRNSWRRSCSRSRRCNRAPWTSAPRPICGRPAGPDEHAPRARCNRPWASWPRRSSRKAPAPRQSGQHHGVSRPAPSSAVGRRRAPSGSVTEPASQQPQLSVTNGNMPICTTKNISRWR